MTATREPAIDGRRQHARATPTLRLLLYPVIAATLLVVGVAGGNLPLVVLAVPFVLSTALGVTTLRPATATTSLRVERRILVEGDTVATRVMVAAPSRTPATLCLETPEGLAVEPASRAGLGPLGVDTELRAEQWGLHRDLSAAIDCEDDFGFVLWRSRWRYPLRFEVHPAMARLRRATPARWVREVTGTHPSRQRGDGIEFAEPRPFTPGDSWRAVNWRISRRRDGVWVNERHPERTADVLLFLDSFGERVGDREITLTMAVQAALALARQHLGVTDRVGLVDLGGVLRWLEPQAGSRQLYRISETLLGSDLILTFADKDLDVIPVRGLPPRSLVVALTPLADPRAVGALFDLRARGYDLAVIECTVPSSGPPTGTEVQQIAHRLRALERDATRYRLRALGVSVVRWQWPEPVESALAALTHQRQRPLHRGRVA